jgi:hypothetical protein
MGKSKGNFFPTDENIMTNDELKTSQQIRQIKQMKKTSAVHGPPSTAKTETEKIKATINDG